MKIEFRPIGIIHSPFFDLKEIPVQPTLARRIKATVEIFEEYQAGLKDLEGFSHIILLTYLHRSKGFSLEVIPFWDSKPRGLFATRSPRRPNPIGLSVVRLLKIEGGILYIENVDLLDGTPLLDLKPYIPEIDAIPEAKAGWFEKIRKKS